MRAIVERHGRHSSLEETLVTPSLTVLLSSSWRSSGLSEGSTLLGMGNSTSIEELSPGNNDFAPSKGSTLPHSTNGDHISSARASDIYSADFPSSRNTLALKSSLFQLIAGQNHFDAAFVKSLQSSSGSLIPDEPVSSRSGS